MRIRLEAPNLLPQVSGGAIDFVALNPQPLPPGGEGRSIDFVALNPQPLPPEPPRRRLTRARGSSFQAGRARATRMDCVFAGRSSCPTWPQGSPRKKADPER